MAEEKETHEKKPKQPKGGGDAGQKKAKKPKGAAAEVQEDAGADEAADQSAPTPRLIATGTPMRP